MSTSRQSTEQQQAFVRQATILRKNLFEWNHMLTTPQGEAWPTMIGRLNAALNQTSTLDRSIEDVLEHFVYMPKQSPVNPQDIPFFLSTRLAATLEEEEDEDTKPNPNAMETDEPQKSQEEDDEDAANALQILTKYENHAAKLAQEYEEHMVRF